MRFDEQAKTELFADGDKIIDGVVNNSRNPLSKNYKQFKLDGDKEKLMKACVKFTLEHLYGYVRQINYYSSPESLRYQQAECESNVYWLEKCGPYCTASEQLKIDDSIAKLKDNAKQLQVKIEEQCKPASNGKEV